MTFLIDLHSIVRWVILSAGVLIALKFAVSWLTKAEYKRLDRILAAGLSGALDLQALVGVVYFIWNGLDDAGFPRHRWEHAFIMVIATVITHVPSRWQKANSPVRFRNTFISFAISLLLIVVGVNLLPGSRW